MPTSSHEHHSQQPTATSPSPSISNGRPMHSSPLNPTAVPSPPQPTSPSFMSSTARPGSRTSINAGLPPPASPGSHQGTFSRIANEELRALSGPYPNAITPGAGASPNRGSMILYRRADSFVGEDALHQASGGAGSPGGGSYFMQPPPPLAGGGGSNRASMYSVSGDSIVSLGMGAGDSKYPPSLFSATPRFSGTPLPGSPLSPPFAQNNSTGVGPRNPINSMYTDPVRGSMFSDNRTSIAFSLNYAGGSVGGGGRGLVAYAYDPEEDDDSEDEEDDWLHDPEVAYPTSSIFGRSGKAPPPPPPPRRDGQGTMGSSSSSGGHSSSSGATSSNLKSKEASTVQVKSLRTSDPTPPKENSVKKPLRTPHPSSIPPNFRGTASWSWRGIVNVTTLVAMVVALLCLFMVYPLIRNRMDEGVNRRITGNTRINATGQAVEGPVAGGNDAETTSSSRSVLNPQGGLVPRSAVLDFVAASASPSPSPHTMVIPTEWYLRWTKPSPVPGAGVAGAVETATGLRGVRGVVYRPTTVVNGDTYAAPTHVPMHGKVRHGEEEEGRLGQDGQVVLGSSKNDRRPNDQQGKTAAGP